jgi:hypothetical protein
MSFHPQNIMLSLDCLGLFYIIHEWINIQGIFILKHHNTRPWSVKPLSKACKIWSNRDNLVVQEGLGAPSLCSLEQKLSWRLPWEEMHFLFMFFLHKMLNHVCMKFLPNTKNSRMCLRIKMWTNYWNIDNTTVPLILWKECNLHSDPSTICHKTNLQRFMNTSMKTLENGFIWHSKFLVGALILFVKKKNGFRFRMWVDFRGLNQFNIKNWYPLPLILGLLD